MQPRITVAIPLHGSVRWVDNVVRNVRNLPSMVTEILISDRSCLDDAADRIRARLLDDPRVKVRAAADGLDFFAHYSNLLEQADGDLFMWMPHDDIFDSQWVPTLAAALEVHPEACLAFGQLHLVEADGVTPRVSRLRPFFSRPSGVLSQTSATRMMLSGYSWAAFRGLFRRSRVLEAGIRLEPGRLIAADLEWVFAIALRSALVYDSRAITWKRRYAGSTSDSVEWRQQNRGRPRDAALAILAQHGPRGFRGLALRLFVRSWSIPHRLRSRVASVLPASLKRRIRAVARWWRASVYPANTPMNS
jgi:GT2 family glycosyltransferase